MFMDQEDKEFRLEIAQYAIEQVGTDDAEWVELADMIVAFCEDEIQWEDDEEEDDILWKKTMPLIKSTKPEAFKKNIKTEVDAGKPVKQAVAIAYAEKNAAAKKPKKKWLTL